MDDELSELGPIDYIVVEFPPEAEADGTALRMLHDLAAAGTIRVLDLAFVRREEDGMSVLELTETGLGDDDVSLFAEAVSGLLDDDDLLDAASALEPGCTAAVLVYENSWAAPFATALRRKGAQLVASGRIPVPAVMASLDALEAAP